MQNKRIIIFKLFIPSFYNIKRIVDDNIIESSWIVHQIVYIIGFNHHAQHSLLTTVISVRESCLVNSRCPR